MTRNLISTPIPRRSFMKGIGVVGAATAVPVGLHALTRGHPGLDAPAAVASAMRSPESPDLLDDPEAVLRSSLSLADSVKLPFGVWLGIALQHREEIREADYHGYERWPITEGVQLVGQGGFYRVVAPTVHFPARKGGALGATHLMVFDTDRVDPVHVQAITVIPLPRRLHAPRGRPVQLRDVEVDVNAGLYGDSRDADVVLSRRLKLSFQQPSFRTT